MEERVRRSLRVVATAEEKLEQLRREKESVRFAVESSLSFLIACVCVVGVTVAEDSETWKSCH